MRPDYNPPAIVEMAEERDRRECIALDKKVAGANRELGQWLLDHPTYAGAEVARWLECGPDRIKRLRVWARDGFSFGGPEAHHKRETSLDAPLKTNDNFQDDTFKPEERTDSIVGGVEYAEHTLKNILRSISQEKGVAEAWRKILKATPFDSEAKAEIYNEINKLIMKWRNVQSTLDRKGQGNGQK